MAKFKKKGKAKAAKHVMVSREDLKRMEKEEALFRRAARLLTSVDAAPATKAYMERSKRVSDAVARTGAPPEPPVARTDATWQMHGAAHRRTLAHTAAQFGRDGALAEIFGAVEAREAAAQEERAVARRPGQRGPRRGAQEAAAGGHGGEEVLSDDVDLKACVNALDGHGDTALVLAARCGHLESCRLLLTRGANPDLANKAFHT